MKCILTGQSKAPENVVESFNGRTGQVLPQSGDYSAADVGAVPTSRTINGKALSVDVTLSASDVGAESANSYIMKRNASQTMTAQLKAGGSQTISTAQVRNVYAGTTELTAGSSSLTTGNMYAVYE